MTDGHTIKPQPGQPIPCSSCGHVCQFGCSVVSVLAWPRQGGRNYYLQILLLYLEFSLFFSTLKVQCQVGVRGSRSPSLVLILLKRIVILLAFLSFNFVSSDWADITARPELLALALFVDFLLFDLGLLSEFLLPDPFVEGLGAEGTPLGGFLFDGWGSGFWDMSRWSCFADGFDAEGTPLGGFSLDGWGSGFWDMSRCSCFEKALDRGLEVGVDSPEAGDGDLQKKTCNTKSQNYAHQPVKTLFHFWFPCIFLLSVIF